MVPLTDIARGLLDSALHAMRSMVHIHGLLWSPVASLPVAGLDAVDVQPLLFLLQQAAGPEDAKLVDDWLLAVQCAQVASDRILLSLREVDRHLRFWEGQLQGGAHGAFMLLGRGPSAFVRVALEGLKTSPGEQLSATDKMQQRVLFLRSMRKLLSEALAEVADIAGVLRLDNQATGQAFVIAGAGGQLASSGLRRSSSNARDSTQTRSFAAQGVDSAAGNELLMVAQGAVAAASSRLGTALQLLKCCMGQLAHIQDKDLHPEATHGGDGEPLSCYAGRELPTTLQPVLLQLGVVSERTLQPYGGQNASHALSNARHEAASLGPHMLVPSWAQRPSALQRHWLRYSVLGGGTLLALRFLYCHSRLAGSDDLDRWTQQALLTAQESCDAHLVQPLLAVRNELFKTFRDRPSIVSVEEFEADKNSLLRMLSDFKHDTHRSLPPAHPSADTTMPSVDAADKPGLQGLRPGQQDEMLHGMQLLMSSYEEELKKPLRNLLTGELARSLLIQVQRLKVDTEAAMLELDQILHANELSISLVAAVPALLLGWAGLAALYRWLQPQAPDVQREAVPLRMAMAQLDRALARCVDKGSTPELEGQIVYSIYQVYREAVLLYRHHDRTSRYSEWPAMQKDLLQLARPGTVHQRIAIHERMTRTFKAFQR